MLPGARRVTNFNGAIGLMLMGLACKAVICTRIFPMPCKYSSCLIYFIKPYTYFYNCS